MGSAPVRFMQAVDRVILVNDRVVEIIRGALGLTAGFSRWVSADVQGLVQDLCWEP